MKRFIYLISMGIVYTLILVAFNFADKQGIIKDAWKTSSTKTEMIDNHLIANLPLPPPPPPDGG